MIFYIFYLFLPILFLGDYMKFLKFIFFLILGLFGCLIIFWISANIYAKISPKIAISGANNLAIYDVNKDLVFSGNVNKDWINLDKVSKNVIKATIASEDKNFYKHSGFDFLRIIKSLIINIMSKDNVQGASTISQQYARNLFLDFDKTWKRKWKEMWVAIKLENHYSKNEILEGYLNTINYGHGIFGIEKASKYYFNKSAKDLTLAEASILVGIPKSPSNYSPIINYEAAKERQLLVLNMMEKNNLIDKIEKEKVYNTTLEFHGENTKYDTKMIMYYQDAVIKELKSISTIPESYIETGGLKIYTNFNIDYQKKLEESANNNLDDNKDLQVAGVVMEPHTGKIFAILGGKDYYQSQFNRAIASKRQVGSTMKPFLYYAALENGFTASTSFLSEKTTFAFGEQTYSPKNAGNIYGNKAVSLAAAISYSENIFAVKTHLFLGEETLLEIAKRVGIKEVLDPVVSLPLGTVEINIIDLTTGYATLANGGYKVSPHFIEKVEDSEGNILYQFKYSEDLVLNTSLTFILNELLTTTYDSLFIDYNYPTTISVAPKMTKKYAVKSGSTTTDNWNIGYNKELLVSIWVGYDDNREIESGNFYYAKNIWIDTIEACLKGHENFWYDIPNNVVGVFIDPINGALANEATQKKKLMYYIKGTQPTSYEPVFKESTGE